MPVNDKTLKTHLLIVFTVVGEINLQILSGTSIFLHYRNYLSLNNIVIQLHTVSHKNSIVLFPTPIERLRMFSFCFVFFFITDGSLVLPEYQDSQLFAFSV